MGKNPIKALAGQTAVYGLGTMIPKFLNFLLTPLYVRVFISGEYGQITDLYAWIAFFIALLTYGMETTFFRFSQKEDSNKVFSNAESSILTTTFIFLILYCIFFKSFANFIHYQHNSIYVLLLGIIVAFDAITAVPFAKLRKEENAKRFSIIKILNVSLNVGLNFLFLSIIPETSLKISESLFGPGPGLLVWVLISNILSSLLSLILLAPQLRQMKFQLDKKILLPMFKYAWPILLIALVGMVNEVADKILIKYLVPIPDEAELSAMGMTAGQYALSQLGIYGASYKLAVLMMIFIQMFRFASEPFFFSHAKDRNAPELYAKVMTYFVIFCLLIFLGVMLYIDIFKLYIGKIGSDYHEGLKVVPIILIANMFYGIVFNLSIWFKLSDKTGSGAVVSICGAATTLICLFVLIPRIGYMGAALAHLACYTMMMSVSYLWGQKVFPIPYQLGRMAIYFAFAIFIFLFSGLFAHLSFIPKMTINTVLIIIYIGFVFLMERKNPLKIE